MLYGQMCCCLLVKSKILGEQGASEMYSKITGSEVTAADAMLSPIKLEVDTSVICQLAAVVQEWLAPVDTSHWPQA
jgi:hypothetical protein